MVQSSRTKSILRHSRKQKIEPIRTPDWARLRNDGNGQGTEVSHQALSKVCEKYKKDPEQAARVVALSRAGIDLKKLNKKKNRKKVTKTLSMYCCLQCDAKCG